MAATVLADLSSDTREVAEWNDPVLELHLGGREHSGDEVAVPCGRAAAITQMQTRDTSPRAPAYAFSSSPSSRELPAGEDARLSKMA